MVLRVLFSPSSPGNVPKGSSLFYNQRIYNILYIFKGGRFSSAFSICSLKRLFYKTVYLILPTWHLGSFAVTKGKLFVGGLQGAITFEIQVK